jgi:hypothetical protein
MAEERINIMPDYIIEKLSEIRTHSKDLLEGKDDSEEERNQHYFWILNAARSVEIKVEGIRDVLRAFMEIDEAIQSGGEPVFLVKQVERIIKSAKKEPRVI